MLSSCAHQTLVIYYTHFIHSTSMVYTAYTSFWTAMSFPWPFPPFPHLLQLPNCPLQLLQGLRVASKPTRLFVDLTLGIYIYIQYIYIYNYIYIYYPESPGTLKGRATYRVVLKGIMEMSRVSTAEEVVEMPGVLRPRAIIYIRFA